MRRLGVKKKNKVIYSIGCIISTIILKVIRPLWGERDLIKVIKGIIRVSIDPKGVSYLGDNRYITKATGWEQLDIFLKDEGYKTSMFFRKCEFWKGDEEPQKLLGKNIGEYFILWEGDNI